MLPTLVLPILIASTNAPQATLPERRQSLTGDIRHHRDFESKILGNKRNLIVYLPPDYAKQTRRYPVVYLHDGQNVFDGLTSYIPNQEWRADEAAEALIRAELIEPLILVGIDNAGIARGDEYLPTRTKFGDNEAGGKDRIRPIAARVGAETFEIHPWP
ncbi:MAG TPA: alpha/beta hydrolase-fold protein, partial [Fimbriimonadaceae bacterium]|nr:alpha/beta hydrolase-fold protein [Fimbriimonadaceae bacterium]